MSSRALRKLQREQEQKRQLEQKFESEDEAEEPSTPEKKPFNAFEMLTEGDNDSAEDPELSDEAAPQNTAPPASNTTPSKSITPSKSNTTKSKSKKKKKKPKAEKEAVNDPAKDEIDRALESLAINSQQPETPVAKPDESYTQLCRLLEVESRHLNALNEMKRLFGNITENEEEHQPARRRRGPQTLDLGGALAARHSPVSRGQGLAGLALRRNVFIMGKEEWPKATSGGLGMELERTDDDGTKHYRFVHNTAYQDVQRQFQSCVESMDPQRMIQMLQFNPYHISTILQVSEIAKQQGDHSVSGDLLERALFSFGRSVHSSFSKAFSEGKARLDFRRPENREFWLASWRYIGNLGQRGTWRTAYEWAKLLLAMEPKDPYRVQMTIDQLALRGGQAEHLLNLSSLLLDDERNNLPNIRISSALAKYKIKRPDESRASLRRAVQNFPWIFARLFKELNIEHIPKSIWGKQPRSERERLECECYVHGAKDLWNTPDAISFLVEVVDTTEAISPPTVSQPITLHEARHVLLSGTPQLLALIPREYTSRPSSSSDPLPPDDNIKTYSAEVPASHRGPAAVYAGPFDADTDNEQFEPEEELDMPRRPTNTAEADAEPVQEPGWMTAFFSRFRAWPNPNAGRPPQTDEDGNYYEETEEPEYDEDANKRWLAGRGMMQLKEFIAEHGIDEGAWSQEVRGRNIAVEYAGKVRLLRETNRRFILDYTLRQGTSQAVKDLVGRLMG